MKWMLVEEPSWWGKPEFRVYRRRLFWWAHERSFSEKEQAEAYIRGQAKPSYYDDNGQPLPAPPHRHMRNER